jgi:Ca2+-binding EF-hand superfamily protein
MGALQRHRFSQPEKSHAELLYDFHVHDRNRDGRIDYPEFKELLVRLDERLQVAEMRAGFCDIDVDRDGLIDFSEFISWWRASSAVA